MEKKELILTVAKDLMIAYDIKSKDIDAEKKIEALGKLLCLMVKEVEQAYNAIPHESTPN